MPCPVRSSALNSATVHAWWIGWRCCRPRDPRGLRHPLVGVLLVAAGAVLAGARSFRAIGQWAAAAPQHTLARLSAPAVGAFDVCLAPSTSTIRRVVGAVCPGGLADLTGTGTPRQPRSRSTAKSARGSRTDDAPAAHLLAAMTGTGRP